MASMDAAGVEFGLLSAWLGPARQNLVSNDEVAEWISQYPGRLGGLATVDLDRDSRDGFQDLARAVITEWWSSALRLRCRPARHGYASSATGRRTTAKGDYGARFTRT